MLISSKILAVSKEVIEWSRLPFPSFNYIFKNHVPVPVCRHTCSTCIIPFSSSVCVVLWPHYTVLIVDMDTSFPPLSFIPHFDRYVLGFLLPNHSSYFMQPFFKKLQVCSLFCVTMITTVAHFAFCVRHFPFVLPCDLPIGMLFWLIFFGGRWFNSIIF